MMPKYSPQQNRVLGTHSSEISLNEWNFVHIWGPIPERITGCRAQCKIPFPPKGLAIIMHGPVQVLVRLIFVLQMGVEMADCLGLCNWQNPCSTNPLFGVKGTERSWNAEDLKGNPTEYAHHTIIKLTLHKHNSFPQNSIHFFCQKYNQILQK